MMKNQGGRVNKKTSTEFGVTLCLLVVEKPSEKAVYQAKLSLLDLFQV